MAESYPNAQKTLWEKEKLLVASNFSFSHSVFKRLVSQGHQKVSLCGNGLRDLWKLQCFGGFLYLPKLDSQQIQELNEKVKVKSQSEYEAAIGPEKSQVATICLAGEQI